MSNESLNTVYPETQFLTYTYIYEDNVLNNTYSTWDLVQNQSQSRVGQGTKYCSCVQYAKAITGFSQSVGQAKYWPGNVEKATIGGIVITSESRFGHVAIIQEIQKDFLILDEANYQHCQHTVGRKLPIDSKLIIGYWKPYFLNN